jgi:hypothetical protein
MAFDLFKEVSDPYSRRARVYPGVIVTLPLSLLTVVLITTKPAWWSAVALLLSLGGTGYFGAQLVRSAGRSKERALWASWGGPPTTQMLRFQGATNRVAVQRRHVQFDRVLPDLQLPDEAAELANPEAANQHYEAATRALIERTRDKQQYDRVFDELCQYGFRRNLWGCRRIGLGTADLGLGLTALLALADLVHAFHVSMVGLAASAITNVLLLMAFALMVNTSWVREAAEAYAQALLASLEQLTIEKG